jgi:hypothetical protein
MTLKTLNFMIDDIQSRQPDIMGILEVVEPLADDLVHNGWVLCDVSSVLTKLRDIRHSIAVSSHIVLRSMQGFCYLECFLNSYFKALAQRLLLEGL